MEVFKRTYSEKLCGAIIPDCENCVPFPFFYEHVTHPGVLGSARWFLWGFHFSTNMSRAQASCILWVFPFIYEHVTRPGVFE
jgi:hypothetical protein